MTSSRSIFRGLACASLISILASCSGDGATSVDVGGLRFVAQPATTAAGTAFNVSVELITSGGQRVTSADDVVTLTVGGGATLTGTTSVTAENGVASFTGLTLTRAGSNYQLTASTPDFSSTSSSFTIEAGAASAEHSLVVLNPATLTPGVSSTATFTFKDAFGNAIAGKSISLSSSLSGVTFTPSSGTTDVNGTFQANVVSTAAGSATVTANVAGLAITLPTSIVIAQAASALRFVTQPGAVAAGAQFGVSVEIISNTGQRITTASNPIALTIAGATLGGTTTVGAVAGLATFTGLTVNAAGAGLVLTATGGGFTVNSTPFAVTAGAATSAQSSVTLPGTLSTGTAASATFTFRDAFNNVIPAAGVSLTSSLAGTVFAPATGTTTAGGTFATSITFATVGTGTITANVNGANVAFPVTVGAPPVVCVPSGSIALGTPLNGTVAGSATCSLNSHPASAYLLTVPPGSTPVVVVSATGTGTFRPELSVSQEPPTNVLFIPPNATPTTSAEWLLAPGTYRITVSSADGSTGAFTLTATSTGAGAAGCNGNGRLLTGASATYTGQRLDPTDCLDESPGGPYYTDIYAIFDARPCTITLTTAFPNFLAVIDANNVIVDLKDGQTTTIISLQSCGGQSGEFYILVSSTSGSVSGPYTLTVTFAGSALRASIVTPEADRAIGVRKIRWRK